MSTFSGITEVATLSESASSKSLYTSGGNYVFELIGLDASLNLDVSASYEDVLIQQGLAAANGLVLIDVSASDFSDMFKITVDSSDIDDLSANDVIYDVSDTTFPSIEYSSATVTSGKVNEAYSDQSLKKDMVRHIAKCITGGYAAADIFSNETDLLNDVVDHDDSFSEAFTSILEGVSETKDPSSNDVLSTAKNLLAVTLNDASGNRRTDLFTDISNSTTSSDTTVTVPLKFYAGDKLVVRINYAPASDHPTGGNVTDRSYKVVLTLQ
jgi:hypothetical protein